MRGALCVFVRDLIASGVLTDMMRGRPAVYATFSSYDEVAHHSGLERADTLEALRKLDGQFAQIERASRYAPRPYEIVVLSDHGQTQGATFKQRNGYGLDELVERSLAKGDVAGIAGGDEQSSMVGHAFSEATGKQAKRAKNDVSDRDVVVLGSGNLGLSTAGIGGFRPAPSSCTPRISRHRPNRSSAPPACTASSRAGARRSRPVCPPRCRSRPSGRRRPRPHTRGSGDVTSCGARPAIPGERRRLVSC